MDRRTAFRRSLIIVATAILLSACTSEDSATGRIASDIEVAGNTHRIVAFVMSPPAAGTDLTAMQAEAARIAAAVAGSLGARTDLSGVQAISVSYIHKHGTSDEHTDDVFDYRRDEAGAFSEHIT